MLTETPHLEPFLKWAGGKRWLTKSRQELFPKSFENYFEPFLGGGAVFFHLNPKKSYLSDKNHQLINVYQQLQTNWERIEEKLKEHHSNHSKEYYYGQREKLPSCPIEQAALFLYLNRTCWNGLFRVNLKGKFNVPIGTKSLVFNPKENLQAISSRLNKATISACDFEESLSLAKSGDLIFADPPYTVKHNHNGFVKYNESIFSWDDQERLANTLRIASNRGVMIVSTNANHSSVRSLYKEHFNVNEVDRSSVLAGKSSARGKTSEILITNF